MIWELKMECKSSVRGGQRFSARNQMAGLPFDLALVELLHLRVRLVLSLQIRRLVYNTGLFGVEGIRG